MSGAACRLAYLLIRLQRIVARAIRWAEKKVQHLSLRGERRTRERIMIQRMLIELTVLNRVGADEETKPG